MRPVGNFQQLKIQPEMPANKHSSKCKAYNTAKSLARNAHEQTPLKVQSIQRECITSKGMYVSICVNAWHLKLFIRFRKTDR